MPEKRKPRKDPPTIELRPSTYQPSKAELEEEFHIDVPGDTVEEKMENFAKALLRPVNIVYKEK